MKLASFIVTVLVGVSAFATKTVYHDYDGALRGIALKNACITEAEVKTINATRTCTKLVPVQRGYGDDKYTDWVCERWETVHAAYPREFTRTVCAEYGQDGYGDGANLVCKRFVQKTEFLPATIKISVVTSNGETDNYPGVTKKFTFPSCD